MNCIARCCMLPRLTQEQRHDLLADAALLSIHEIFEAVPDPRSSHGLRYDLPFLLTCLVAGLLCNCNSTEAVAQWCQDQQPLLRRLFGPRLFLTGSRVVLSLVAPPSECRRPRATLWSLDQSPFAGSC